MYVFLKCVIVAVSDLLTGCSLTVTNQDWLSSGVGEGGVIDINICRYLLRCVQRIKTD